MKADFKRFSPKFTKKLDCKARKAFKDTLGVPLKCLYHRDDTLYSHRKHKSKIKDFSKNRTLKAKSFTKMQRRFWWKKHSKMEKRARNRPRIVEKRFCTPKLHLDPIWNQFRSNEFQKMKMLCPPLYSDVLDAVSLYVSNISHMIQIIILDGSFGHLDRYKGL